MINTRLHKLFAALLGCFVLFTYCNNNSKDKSSLNRDHLPEVVKLDQLKATEFLPTLENVLDERKNSIYAAAFLYAWDSLKAIYKNPIQLSDTNSDDLKLVNQSISYLNTLKRNEYSINAYTDEDLVFVEAFFNKTLPFPKKLDKSDRPILFDKQKVSAFGLDYYDYEVAEFCEISFYANDEKFILTLKPKDEEHEIVLVKGLGYVRTFADAVSEIKKMIKQGEKEKRDLMKSWRYSFNEADVFSIPVIKYNIETNYKSLLGQGFTTGVRSPAIELAYQRTGFVLDENGAVVESHGDLVTEDSAYEATERPKPKRMIFDKPFFIMVKRKDQPNPYFMMRVANAELLKKE